MNILYGKDKYFIGAVKFFDVNKNFGFIASNNCNMPTSRYEQDFYVDSSSFIEEKAKGEGCIVVFQVEKQENGKKKAVNVRRITKSNEDLNLALSYYGDYEYITYKDNKKVNLYSHISKPIELVAEKVQAIIENEEERSPEKTVKHFKFFIEHYKEEKYSKDCYIFDRHYSTDEKHVWETLFSVLTYDERLALLKIYPSVVRYFNDDKLIHQWLDEKLVNNCSLSDLKQIEKNFSYISPELIEFAKTRITTIVDLPIKELFVELSQRCDISENELSSKLSLGHIMYNEKLIVLDKLHSYLHLTTKQYHKEKKECLASVKENRFKKELNEFLSLAHSQFRRENFFNYLKSLPGGELNEHIQEVKDKISSILDEYIEKRSFQEAIYLLKNIQILGDDYLSSYKQKLYPLITEVLTELLRNNLDNPHRLDSDFFSSYSSFTSIYDKEEKNALKKTFIPILRKTNSVHVLSDVSTGNHNWLPIEEALELTKQLISLWNYETIKTFVNSKVKLFANDERFSEIIIEKANELVGDIPLNNFFDGTPLEENKNNLYSRNPERENCSFLNNLKVFIPDNVHNVQWNSYVNSRNADELLIMFEYGVIDSLPESIVKRIINSISLESVCTSESRWYKKPLLQNLTYRKVLETTHVDLFPLIENRLIGLDLSGENIPLAILLTELMSLNKPKEDDQYALSEWEKQFRSRLISLKNNTSSNPRISVILWSVYFQTATSMAILAEVFPELPPYIQIRCVKKIFQLIAMGKICFTAESLYNLLTKSRKQICFPLEIVFAYLKRREQDSSAVLDNGMMLQLLNEREDHAEWVGIRQFITECSGRWITKELMNDRSNWKRNHYFNGLVEKCINGNLRIYVPHKMIDEHKKHKEYNNKYFQNIVNLIRLTYKEDDYRAVNETHGVSYYFSSLHEPELFAIARPFNLKFNGLDNFLDFEKKDDEDDYFCECRLSNKVDNNYQVSFYWCGNKPCFRPPVRYMLDNEWEHYTLLDFMRILNIPADYISKTGKKTLFGHYIILSAYLKSFAKFYQHLKCRGCGKLMRPLDISNFTTRAVTEFACVNDGCVEKGNTVYLNHCFNKRKCNATIDSRDSKQCPNGQYICPECGACCSTENFRLRISNLHMTGGYISDRLKLFVQNELGHWEKNNFFCYKCGAMTEEIEGVHTCVNCGVQYNHQ